MIFEIPISLAYCPDVDMAPDLGRIGEPET